MALLHRCITNKNTSHSNTIRDEVKTFRCHSLGQKQMHSNPHINQHMKRFIIIIVIFTIIIFIIYDTSQTSLTIRLSMPKNELKVNEQNLYDIRSINNISILPIVNTIKNTKYNESFGSPIFQYDIFEWGSINQIGNLHYMTYAIYWINIIYINDINVKCINLKIITHVKYWINIIYINDINVKCINLKIITHVKYWINIIY
eukprot:546679_1